MTSQTTTQAQAVRPASNGMSVAGFVLALAPIPNIAPRRSRVLEGRPGRGLAITGLIVGWPLAVLLSLSVAADVAEAQTSGHPRTEDRTEFSVAVTECTRSIKSRTAMEQTNLKRTISASHLHGAHFEEAFAAWCVERGAYVPLVAPYIYGVGDPHQSQRLRSFPCYQRWEDGDEVEEGDSLQRIQQKLNTDPAVSIAEDGQWGPGTRAAVETYCGIEVGDIEVTQPPPPPPPAEFRSCAKSGPLRFCVVGGYGEGTTILGYRYLAFEVELTNEGNRTAEYDKFNQDLFLSGVSLGNDYSTVSDPGEVTLRPGAQTEVILGWDIRQPISNGDTVELIFKEGAWLCDGFADDCSPTGTVRFRLSK